MSCNIDQAYRHLIQGGIVGIPTETVYGLATNALNTEALHQLYTLKERPLTRALTLHTHSLTSITHLIKEIPSPLHALSKRYSPGPLTILLPKTSLVPNLLTAGNPMVAVRIPNHPIALQLLSSLPFPLAIPSANKFTKLSPTTYESVRTHFSYHELPCVIDGGTCNIGIESTIIAYDATENVIYLHRYGSITEEEIAAYIGLPVRLAPTATQIYHSHYLPQTPLYYTQSLKKEILKYTDKKIGVLSFSKSYQQAFPNIAIEKVFSLKELSVVVRSLYSFLHYCDTLSLTAILVEQLPSSLICTKGLAATLHDRLQKAST